MVSPGDSAAADRHSAAPLNSLRQLRRTPFYRVFAAVYTCAISALLYHHTHNLLHSTTFLAFSTALSLLIADLILAFMWVSGQSFRMRPVRRRENLNNLERVTDFPGLDVFICTADPYKEPPMSVVNTALSVMGYDYPTDKISVYVSDDGGSELTLFAFLEAARFAAHWLPFCRSKKILDRSPETYFCSNKSSRCSETDNIKIMYEKLRVRVEQALEMGKISDEHLIEEHDRQIFVKWIDSDFTRQDHPAVIQILLESGKDKDTTGHSMPNLIYVSREKCKSLPHHFKAGALNALVRVSGVMTNSPLILTLDCDTYSNDPNTPSRALCYFCDPQLSSELAYVQFPQCFHGINKNDIYNSELLYLFKINPLGMDGFRGPNYVGAGCFFSRRCFFGPPSGSIPELGLDHVKSPIRSEQVLAQAHEVAGCNFENQTTWGSKMGFRYGSLVEDFNTGYHLQCEGWRGLFCDPERPAFYGDVPITLIDALNQVKRWSLGLLEVCFSEFSPVTFGVRKLGPIMALTYGFYAFWPFWSIPVVIYTFLPQLSLLNGLSIFPKVSEPMFMLYTFLVLGSYGQNYLDIALHGETFKKWFSSQRMWMIRSLSAYLFGCAEFLLKSAGVSAFGFNVTSKVLDDEQSKRYDQGVFEFGVASPMFVPLVMAAIINLVSFLWGIKVIFGGGRFDLVPQLLVSGFVVLNCWPVYEAMVLRSDKGKIPTKISVVSALLVLVMCRAFAFTIGN